jgi:hypothetical protein
MPQEAQVLIPHTSHSLSKCRSGHMAPVSQAQFSREGCNYESFTEAEVWSLSLGEEIGLGYQKYLFQVISSQGT